MSDERPPLHAVETEQEKLWAAQNERLDGLNMVTNAIALLHEFPIKRRTRMRRVFTHWAKALWPFLFLLVFFVVLAIVLHQGSGTCEPYTGC